MTRKRLLEMLWDLMENLPCTPEIDKLLNNASRALKQNDFKTCFKLLDEAAKIGRSIND